MMATSGRSAEHIDRASAPPFLFQRRPDPLDIASEQRVTVQTHPIRFVRPIAAAPQSLPAR